MIQQRFHLGKAFSSSYADINYDKDNSKVHYVMLYPDGVSGDGIMMTVDFKLLGTDKSYQPELKINSLIDSSNEMNEILYSIKYQQETGVIIQIKAAILQIKK